MYIKNPHPGTRATAADDPQELLRRAVAAAKAGNKSEARHLLYRASRLDPDNERVWLWRASVAQNIEEAVGHMRQVLRINPEHPKAKLWMERARKATGASAVERRCSLCREPVHTQAHQPCSSCGAIAALDEMDAILRYDGADQEQMVATIARAQEELAAGSSVEARLTLALAYLHQKRSIEALVHLREASRLRPGDPDLARACDQLQARKLVLVVDDDLAERERFRGSLERFGVRVRLANTGLQALAALDMEQPVAIVLDVSLPELGGWEVCRVLRANVATKPIPIVLMSERGGPVQRWRARQCGAAGLLCKPFETERLVSRLSECLPGGGPVAARKRLSIA